MKLFLFSTAYFFFYFFGFIGLSKKVICAAENVSYVQ